MKQKITLPPDKIASLHDAQRQLSDILPQIDDAEACGIDCQEYRRVHAEAMDRIQQLLTRFGGNSTGY